MMRLLSSFTISALTIFTLGGSSLTWADAKNLLTKENPSPNATANYWTPERLRNARPMPLPEAQVQPKVSAETLDHQSIKGDSGDGAPPEEDIKPIAEQLYRPRYELPTQNQGTFDRGTSNENFSSSRLVPISADLSYPYSAVGKLFFTIPGQGDFVCSASVLRPRIVVTAGHCVHSGSGGSSGFYTNWLFVPAFRDGTAPFQSWKWTFVAVTPTWSTGGGGVPNAADYAMLEVEDKPVNGTVRRIGEVVGFLGFQTVSLIPNHAHLLGYPCNLDSCQKMHQVAAQSARAVAPNNAEYGSDMRGGSSGGPWVQNFGALAIGQTGGNNPGLNRVIGITSWGFTSSAPKSQGSSIPDVRFTDLLTGICAHRPNNC